MKKYIFNKVPFTYSFAISCLLFAIINLSVGCNKMKPENPSGAFLLQQSNALLLDTLKYPETQQLIIWKKPGNNTTGDLTGRGDANSSRIAADTSMAAFNRWIDTFKVNYPGTKEITCKNCTDSTLKLLYGPNVWQYIQTNTVHGNTQPVNPTTASGEDGPLYFCINFRVRRPENSRSDVYTSKINNFAGTGTPVNVAVFDTGLDTTGTTGTGLKNFLYKSINAACIPGANNGWNFVTDKPNYYDDNEEKHGTSVARFAIDQVVYSKIANRRSIRVLPVKTNDANGVGDLFSMLCGFTYAKERNVQIINTSIGFSEPEPSLKTRFKGIDPNVRLLQEFVYHYLTLNKILLVAAAGNYDPAGVDAAFIFNNLTPTVTDYNNLNQFSFFPASLARDTNRFWNVIAVTTIDTLFKPRTVSPYQHFSPKVVDFGVKADALIPDSIDLSKSHYVFNNPIPTAPPNGTSEGSSFAAPIVTGKLCAKYTQVYNVMNAPGFSKYKILDIITQGKSSYLTTRVRAGRYVDK